LESIDAGPAFGFAANLAEKRLRKICVGEKIAGEMSTFARPRDCGRAVVGALISVAFFWTLLLTVSPQLHAHIHADGNRPDHACAVTLIATGSYDHAAHPPLVSAPRLTPRFSEIAALSSTWVRPLFLSAHIFEHAPPALG
jgi:hypothetical protein